MFVLYGFLFFYALNIIINGFEKIYYIICDANEKVKEEEDKNITFEAIKHLYS